MTENKIIVEEIRESFKEISKKITKLKENGVLIKLEIGTESKTVLFPKTEHFEVKVVASVSIPEEF